MGQADQVHVVLTKKTFLGFLCFFVGIIGLCFWLGLGGSIVAASGIRGGGVASARRTGGACAMGTARKKKTTLGNSAGMPLPPPSLTVANTQTYYVYFARTPFFFSFCTALSWFRAVAKAYYTDEENPILSLASRIALRSPIRYSTNYDMFPGIRAHSK